MTTGVLFVCLGNICRSPTAHGIFEAMVAERGLQSQFVIDSAGTGDWHVGRPPDSRAAEAARQRGYELAHLRARQVGPEDFRRFDYLLAMDRSNLSDLQRMAPPGHNAELALFLSYGRCGGELEVPDPYYGGAAGFAHVLDLVEDAAAGLLDHILAARRP